MNLKILLPSEVLVEEEVNSITAEAQDGSFTLLPGHIDFTSGLVPGILSFRTSSDGQEDGVENFAAIDDGILVKKGSQVLISTRHGVHSTELEKLRRTVVEEFERRDQRERKARTVLARLESNIMDRFIELE